MDRYIQFVLDRPKSVLLVLLVITVLLGLGIPKLTFDTSVDVMMPQHDEQYLYNEEVKRIYGNLGKLIVMDIASKNLWSSEFFGEVEKFTEDLEEFQKSDEAREEARLARFREIIKNGHFDKEKIIASFADDPVYARAIQRALFALPLHGEVLNPILLAEAEKRLLKMKDLKKQKLVDRIITPVTIQNVSGQNDTLKVVNLVPEDTNGKRIIPKTAADFETYKKRLFMNPAFEGALFAKDKATGEITGFAAIIRFENIKKDDEISREIWNIAKSYQSIDITPQGIPITNMFMSDYMKRDLLSFLPLVLLVVLVVFYLNFRTIRGMLLPMATLILTDVWIMGLMGHLGINITVVGTSLPALMVSVGSSYSIHILNQYYIDLSSILSAGKKRGLKLAMSHIAITVMLAGFTTFVGFASLATNQVTGIRDWGIFSSIGVVFAVIISTSMIPAVLMLVPQKHPRSLKKEKDAETHITENWLTPFITRLIHWSIFHHRKVLACLAIVIALALAGAVQMKVDTNFLSYFKEHDYVRESVLLIGNRYGGTSGFSILIDSGQAEGVKDPAFLHSIDEFRSWLTSPKNIDLSISRTDAFTDVIKTMHMAMNNDDLAYWRIPDKKSEVMDYLEIYAGDDDNFDGRYDDFEPYIDQQYRTALVFAKIHHHKGELLATSDVKRIQAKIDEHLKKNLPAPYAYRITGEPAVMVRMSEYQISGQMSSLALSLVVVFLIVVGLFKSWNAGFVSLIPMSTAVILNFGIMGWTGIALDAATSIIAAVTIGIGIDDTIHFLNTYRHYRKKGLSVDDTIRRTLSIAGTAIIYTSIALIFGFSVLTVSNFKPLIYTGLLIANTMVATTIGALVLLPSAIKAVGGKLDPSPSESIFWKIFYIGRFFDFEDNGNEEN